MLLSCIILAPCYLGGCWEMLVQHYARTGDADDAEGETAFARRKRRGTRSVGSSETRRERARRQRQRQRDRERDRERAGLPRRN